MKKLHVNQATSIFLATMFMIGALLLARSFHPISIPVAHADCDPVNDEGCDDSGTVGSSGGDIGNSGSVGNPGGDVSGGSATNVITNPLNGASTIDQFVNLILTNVVLPVGAVICVLAIIYAGFLLVTARGDEKKLETGKKALLYAVIGTAILLGAVAISQGIKATLDQITK